MNDYLGDQRRSVEAFVNLTLPRIKSLFGNHKFYPVEMAVLDGDSDLFDTLSGIDVWAIGHSHIFGVASRVQKCKKPYETFTIRKSRHTGATTELEKLTRAIDKGFIIPTYFCQSYVSEDWSRLFAYCIVRTKELIHLINTVPDASQTRVNGFDGNEFVVVEWSALDVHGIKNIKWTAKDFGYTLSHPSPIPVSQRTGASMSKEVTP